jgi:uncharacterized membrane protein YhaH (DUF805 family)
MDWGKFLFSFSGRISRKAFWLYMLGLFALNILVLLVSPQPQISADMTAASQFEAAMAATPWWHWPLMLVMLYVSLAVYTKRWHDQDRSGWWNLLILLTPILFIGPMIMLGMLGLIGSTPGPNRFGEEPVV